MHIHVLGVGSIGSLLALHLRQSTRHPVTLLVKRKPFAQTFRNELQHTITIEHNGTQIRADGFNVELTDPASDVMLGLLRRPDGQLRSRILLPRTATPSSAPQPSAPDGPISCLLVTTKAPSTFRAIRALAPRLSATSTILLLQNGMGVYEELCAKLFPAPSERPHFILASTTHGAWAKTPFHVVHAARGDIAFGVAPSDRVDLPLEIPRPKMTREDYDEDSYGADEQTGAPYTPWLERLAPHETLFRTVRAILSLRGLSPHWLGAGELQERIQRKLVTNSVINPLTALMGCRNGLISTNAHAKHVTKQVCREAESVFRAQAVDDLGGSNQDGEKSPMNLRDVELPFRLTAPSLESEVARVARMTAYNFSSMLQDVKKGHETEVEYMNGYLCRMGTRYGVSTPVNDMLRTLVKMRAEMPAGEEK